MPTRQYRRTKIAGKLGRPAAEIYEIRPEATGIPRRYRARKPKTVTVQLAVAPAVVAPRIVDPIEAPVVSHIKSGSPVDGARVLQKMRGLRSSSSDRPSATARLQHIELKRREAPSPAPLSSF
jgi:hypothetical protein